jgi:hypothetical protein
VSASLRRLRQPVGLRDRLASKNNYENSILPNGMSAGTPEEALDCACGLYLDDPTAWHIDQPPTNLRS